jgi:hypothetical protein
MIFTIYYRECFVSETTLNTGSTEKFNKVLQFALKTGHPMLNVSKAKLKELSMDLLDVYMSSG